jgi:integrase
MALTDPAVKNAKPAEKPYKLADGNGMYLLVSPAGAKYWRLKYRYSGKEKVLALGVYPKVTLRDARRRREEARDRLAQGVDPGAARKAGKREARLSASNTFEAVARDWYEVSKGKWSDRHAGAVLRLLERELFPALGSEPIASIEAPQLLDVLRGMERRDVLELASKVRVMAGQVFRYAIVTGRAKQDPSRDLRGALKTREQRHYAKLDEADMPEFLARLDAYDGNLITKLAIKLLVLTFVRTGELRGAKWTEFDMEKREWRVPAERMKTRVEHLVPLSDQSLSVLTQLRAISGSREFVFPNEHHPLRPMSENTILFALYRMGYRGRATGHGFRATASTILNEQGWDPDVIERQLAHKEANKVRAAYHRAEYLSDRKRLLQHWADYIDRQRRGESRVAPGLVNLSSLALPGTSD